MLIKPINLSKSIYFFSEKAFLEQFVPLGQIQKDSQEKQPELPTDTTISKKSITELLDLCRICELFTSDKPLECKRNCLDIPKREASSTKSGTLIVYLYQDM